MAAAFVDPDFRWMEITDPFELATADLGPAASGIGRSHLVAVRHTAELAPSPVASNAAISALIHVEEAPQVVQDLVDFLRLPDIIQQEVALLAATGRFRVLVVANIDRIEEFWPRVQGTAKRTIELLNRHGITLISTQVGDPRPARFDYDYVVHVRESDKNDYLAVCEQGRTARCLIREVFPTSVVSCDFEKPPGKFLRGPGMDEMLCTPGADESNPSGSPEKPSSSLPD